LYRLLAQKWRPYLSASGTHFGLVRLAGLEKLKGGGRKKSKGKKTSSELIPGIFELEA
jgi:hypothetical protein